MPMSFTARQCRNCRAWSPRRGQEALKEGLRLQHRDLMMQARARLDEAVDAIRRIPGYEDFLKEPGWEDIAAAVVEGQPLVYIAAAPGGGVALIVHRSPGSADASVETVPLDGFSEERLQEHLKIWFDAYGGWQKALHDVEVLTIAKLKKSGLMLLIKSQASSGRRWQSRSMLLCNRSSQIKPS